MYEIPISLDLVGTMGFVQNSNARLLQIDCRIDKAPFRHCNMLQPCKKGEKKNVLVICVCKLFCIVVAGVSAKNLGIMKWLVQTKCDQRAA